MKPQKELGVLVKSTLEQDVLVVVLKELRRAMRMKGQLSIIIDPWTAGGGTYVHASPNTEGRSYEIASRAQLDKRKR